MFKSGYVTILGRPNVGKSTLLNQILKEKISIISDKAQTTREKITLIYTEERGQIIFLDTPGMQDPRNKLGEYMKEVSLEALEDVDIIVTMVDVSDYIGRKDKNIFSELEKFRGESPLFLLINKIDQIQKDEILPLIAQYDELALFNEIIPISAAKGENVDAFLDTVFDYLEEGPAYYEEDMITDKPEKFIVAEMIREKGLLYLKEEVPHGLAVRIDAFKEREGENFFDIDATIFVEKESHKGIVIGKGGEMIKRIGISARRDIEAFLDARVNLELHVKVSKNWRDMEEQVARFGYK